MRRKEMPPVAPAAAAVEDSIPLFERLMALAEETGPLRINCEDLSGILQDAPDFRLSREYRIHSCDFCEWVHFGADRRCGEDCNRHKASVNRLALRRLRPFEGMCPKGVTDLVHPFVVSGHCLGVLYYGSVVVRETERSARARLLRYCRRRKLQPGPFLARWRRLPRVRERDLPRWRERLRLVAEAGGRILEAHGLPLEHYRSYIGPKHIVERRFPGILLWAIDRIRHAHDDRLSLSSLAADMHCSAGYLSRLFREHTGRGFSAYVQQIRVDHARRLLMNPDYAIGEIGYLVGFEDASYFAKTFRRHEGMTPSAYRARILTSSIAVTGV